MSSISQTGEKELIFSLENLRPLTIMVSDLENRKIDQGEPGIYIFLGNIRPHHVYIGRTGNIGRRTFEQRRLRRTYSDVLIFRLEGYLDEEIAKEIESRALRMAFQRWPWATWSNENDLQVSGHDRYACQGHPVLVALVEKILRHAEAHMESIRGFKPTPDRILPVTHQVGSPSAEFFARGSLSKKGMVILKGSRLPLSMRYIENVRELNTRIARIALGLHWLGILDRRPWTVNRNEGVYFMQDFLVQDAATAASLIRLDDQGSGSNWLPVQIKSLEK